MAHFIEAGRPTNLIHLSIGNTAAVDLFGGGPGNEPLDVMASDPAVFSVSEVPVSVGRNLRRFDVRGLAGGSALLLARLGQHGAVWAQTRVIVNRPVLYRYYHGTSSDIADILIGVDLEPMLLSRLYAAAVTMFDWTDYTDFGKGFYVHLEENRGMAYEWARRRFQTDWAVVEFVATPPELQDLWTTALHFGNKADRPRNSPRPVTVTTSRRSIEICPVPQILPIVPCVSLRREETTVRQAPQTLSWLEFVEHNRHIVRGGALIARPNDRDWTGTYSRIRGPIWVPRDSGFDTGLPPFADHVHQLNWGRAGMAVLNLPESKTRRFKFSSTNEGLFPPPAR
jgi:hypothetical protein